jgi:hypothetical protein
MNKNRNAGELAEEALNSFDGMQTAEPPPFFYTRLMARMEAGRRPNAWDRITAFLARPAVALAAILLVLAVNVWVVTNRSGAAEEGTETISALVMGDTQYEPAALYELNNETDEQK